MRTLNRIFIAAASFFIVHAANAQLCLGSLGDPIVNITFGAGSNPGPALNAATTNYQFITGDCPDDGSYTVRNNTLNCFSSSWHSLSADHTGNTGGYFMLVNASFAPGAFYVDTVKGLCSNTTFEFAAWIVNVLKSSACGSNGIQPNLTFTIEKTDGTLLQTYNSNNISQQSSPVWKQYGFFFDTPPGVSDVVLRIINNAQGGCGNDLALDDITFRPCGPQLTPVIDGYIADTAFFCKGTAKTFTFRTSISAGFNNPSYQWQQTNDGITWQDIPGATAAAYTVNFTANTAAGNYLFRVSAAEQGNLNSAKCRVASSVLTIEVSPVPITSIGINSPVCEGETVTVTAAGATQYLWTGNGINSVANPLIITNVQPGNAGKIFLLATSDKGCTHLDSVLLNVFVKPVVTVLFDSTSICSGNSIQLSASGSGSYQWTPLIGLSAVDISNPVASPATTTVYRVVLTGANACADTASVNITVIEKPAADAGPDKTILAGSAVLLTAAAGGQDIRFSWSPADHLTNPNTLQPLAAPPEDMDYTLTVTSNAGCGVDIDKVHVFVFKDIYIPNAFSPDGNTINDTWKIPALNAFPGFELAIYNRLGQLIYQCNNSYQPWDGTFKGEPQPPGVYVYVIDLKQPGIQLLKGTLMLIR
ncbi:MAG: gliding motility-associated C-terminal domain-containing protein [Chitinophagaceae bacterium]|nr:gliding motility-associated C-terminal domain-containing protein [Chitinophagaceae bacterium]